MKILTVTTTNHPDPTCRRLKLTKHFEITDLANPAPFVRECIKHTETSLREVFPQGMTYSVPYTEVDVNETDDESEDRRLLRTAYASGQLQGTMIGERIEKHFGVPYDDFSITGCRPVVPSPSEEDTITNRMDADARRSADAKAVQS